MSKAFVSGYQGSANFGQEAVIAASGTKTGVISMGGFTLVGIKVPALFTGVALTFEMSDAADGTFVPVKNTTSGTALSYTVAPSGYYVIDPKDFYGINFLKIVSGATEGVARTLVCSMKGF